MGVEGMGTPDDMVEKMRKRRESMGEEDKPIAKEDIKEKVVEEALPKQGMPISEGDIQSIKGRLKPVSPKKAEPSKKEESMEDSVSKTISKLRDSGLLKRKEVSEETEDEWKE